MIEKICQHCNRVVDGYGERVITRVGSNFNIQLFCSPKCCDKHFLKIGIQTITVIILVIVSLSWYLAK